MEQSFSPLIPAEARVLVSFPGYDYPSRSSCATSGYSMWTSETAISALSSTGTAKSIWWPTPCSGTPSRSVRPSHAAAWRFQRNTYGRPGIQGGISDARLRFNLSHTRGLSACAVTQDFDIGIDVEWMNRRLNPEELMDLVFSLEEARALRSLPLPDQSQRFFVLWTLKEAYIKARGMGLRAPIGPVYIFSTSGTDVQMSRSLSGRRSGRVEIPFRGPHPGPTGWRWRFYV